MHTSTYLEDFLSMLYPNVCIGCENLLPKGSKYICPKCQFDLPKTNNHEVPVPAFQDNFLGIVDVSDLYVYCYFRKGGLVQKLLHELKYNDAYELGVLIGNWYGKVLKPFMVDKHFDFIVPVPLHPSKFKKRGYNQSEAFGEGLSQVLGIEQDTNLLRRVKHLSTLTRMTKLSRIKEMEGVFECQDRQELKGKSVLLVDDVLTTGTTLIACIEAMNRAGIDLIAVATIAGVK